MQWGKFMQNHSNSVAQSGGEHTVCLEYSVVERDGHEVVEGEISKGLATGDQVYLTKKIQIHNL